MHSAVLDFGECLGRYTVPDIGDQTGPHPRQAQRHFPHIIGVEHGPVDCFLSIAAVMIIPRQSGLRGSPAGITRRRQIIHALFAIGLSLRTAGFCEIQSGCAGIIPGHFITAAKLRGAGKVFIGLSDIAIIKRLQSASIGGIAARPAAKGRSLIIGGTTGREAQGESEDG